MVFVAFFITVTLPYFSKSHFLEPTEQSLVDEVFQYDGFYEYIISNQFLEWDQATSVCRYEFDGSLATLETDELKRFAAEAMSESNMLLDSLWIGLQKANDTFRWLNLNITISDDELLQCGNNSITCGFHCLNTMNCGAIARINHTEPCIVRLRCDANRGFICKRPTNKDDQSTHHGWIRIGQRLYKIFTKQLTYDEANTACINKDPKARLAVIDSFKDAQKLGRYLLVGRPSLERVWIGARWEDYSSQYEFEHESIHLSNITDSSRYPPWRRGRMTKPFGCILLDRHLTNVTYFVESYCSRFHSYMCYKTLIANKSTDICDIGDYDWRIFYNHLDWFQASRACKQSGYSGRLAIVEQKDIQNFIDIMEGSKRYLLHVWLGAFYHSGVWIWSYTNNTLPAVEENGYPPWVKNKTYTEEVEKNYLCLNIDRENPLKALFYGTLCSYPQAFVCQYDKGTVCEHFNHTTITAISTVTTFTTTRFTTKEPVTTIKSSSTFIISSTTTTRPTTTLSTTIESTSLTSTRSTITTRTSRSTTTRRTTTRPTTTTTTTTTRTLPTTKTRQTTRTTRLTTTRTVPTTTTRQTTTTKTRRTRTTRTRRTTATKKPTRTTSRRTRPTRFTPSTTKVTRRTKPTKPYTGGLWESTVTSWPDKRIKEITLNDTVFESSLYSTLSDTST
ncbi:hypothetical protein ILUMI_10444 [Ignelater luminosus]|uniref:C-type lectin domain-containing protein n=1 Tax=Ignelater luminosus TaxID=2038154 RepID=A0A8K0G8P8_IGNLU|nr:hypothetical protein ILUMI_10444 [Ignelater luminosus]